MGRNQTVPPGPRILKEDADAFAALKGITTYKSTKDDNSIANLQVMHDNIPLAADARAKGDAKAKSLRDEEIATQWAFHNGILSAKKAVGGRYGDDSNEIQALGLKKKSERKTPRRAAKPKTPPSA